MEALPCERSSPRVYQPASTIGLPYVDSLLAFMIALDDQEEEEEEKEEMK